MRYYFYYKTPMEDIGIAENGMSVTNIWFGRKKNEDEYDEYIEQETHLLIAAASELQAYFAGELKVFSVPVAPQGTVFQQKVWQALCSIPYGETVSYGEIAAGVGNPKACRAVGMANNKNPVPILIPCHRVIGADGSLTGYAGGLEVKKYLLAIEQHHKNCV